MQFKINPPRTVVSSHVSSLSLAPFTVLTMHFHLRTNQTSKVIALANKFPIWQSWVSKLILLLCHLAFAPAMNLTLVTCVNHKNKNATILHSNKKHVSSTKCTIWCSFESTCTVFLNVSFPCVPNYSMYFTYILYLAWLHTTHVSKNLHQRLGNNTDILPFHITDITVMARHIADDFILTENITTEITLSSKPRLQFCLKVHSVR